jgi:uncharacterized membrane protein
MALIGRLHPLLVHFPIALVIAAAVAESAAMLTGSGRWRTLAAANVIAGAAFALAATLAGWRLALDPRWSRLRSSSGTAGSARLAPAPRSSPP